MRQKHLISNNNWFELSYPAHWTQTEDDENGTYIFMDNDDWKGTLRITALRFVDDSGQPQDEKRIKYLEEEFNEIEGASRIKLGDMDAVQYIEESEEDEGKFLMNFWSTGKNGVYLICSFTADKTKSDTEEVKKELQYAIQTLESIRIK